MSRCCLQHHGVGHVSCTIMITGGVVINENDTVPWISTVGIRYSITELHNAPYIYNETVQIGHYV